MEIPKHTTKQWAEAFSLLELIDRITRDAVGPDGVDGRELHAWRTEYKLWKDREFGGLASDLTQAVVENTTMAAPSAPPPAIESLLRRRINALRNIRDLDDRISEYLTSIEESRAEQRQLSVIATDHEKAIRALGAEHWLEHWK